MSPRRSDQVIAAGVPALVLAFAGLALAAAGDLTSGGCVEDDDSATDDCGGVLSPSLNDVRAASRTRAPPRRVPTSSQGSSSRMSWG